jgi:Tfp pilus assembly protein PilX
MRIRPIIAARLRDERGIALVMAIGVSFVLALLGASVILFTTSNERHAKRQNATVTLYDIAQAGIDSAASQLGNLASDDPNRHSATFFSSMSAADRTATIDSGTVVWNGTLTDTTPPYYNWRLTATATMPNPTKPGATMTRTLSADLPLVPDISQVPNTTTWKYIYSRSNDSDPNTCDQTIQNNPGLTASFYVNGDLCLDNSSNVYGPLPGNPTVDVVVKGRAYLNHPATSLGTVTRPLSSIEVDGGCKYRTNPLHAPPVPCTAIDSVWPNSTWSGPIVTAPTADYTTWYAESSPGPTHPCEQSTGTPPVFDDDNPAFQDRGAGTVDITPNASYTCVQRGGGQLSWNNTTKVLTLSGTIFIDGNIDFASDGLMRYSGMAAIYTTGSVRFRQSILCAQINAANTGCDPAWTNSTTNVLVFVTQGTGTPALTGAGITLEQSSGFQGALFAAGNMTFENNTWVQGPMIADREVINNSMFFNYIPTLVNVPFGAPGTPIVKYNLAPVRHYVG